MRILFLLIAAVLLSASAYSQGNPVLISGIVLDSVTGESLPSATILIEDSYNGTISNVNGRFTLEVNPLQFPLVLQVRYIGYQTERIPVNADTDFPLEITLSKAVTEMQEIVVTDRDPGLSIMETVIARKQIWRGNLNNFRAEAYTRQVLSNDTSIVSISESRSLLYWDREMGPREIQSEARQTSNLSAEQNFSGVRYLPNFYDDNIDIAGYNMVGITHPDALRYYNFSLIETTFIDDFPVYRIEVIPKRERQPLFTGEVFVDGDEFALLEVNLKPNRVVSFPPPVQDFNLAYRQQFSDYGRDFWLPVDVRIEGRVRVGFVGLQFPAIQFRQISILSDYDVNTQIPDSIFADENEFVRADSTLSDSSLVKREMPPVPFTEEEENAYATIDSTSTLEEAFQPSGFLSRLVDDSDEDEERDGGGIFMRLGGVVPSGISFRGRFNRMDGFHAGIGYTREFDVLKNRLKLGSGYSFYSKKWDMMVSLRQQMARAGDTAFLLDAGYENITDTRYESEVYPLFLNSITAAAGARDYFDYYRNEKISMALSVSGLIPDTRFSIGGTRERHQNFEGGVYDYSLFGWHKTRRENVSVTEGRLHAMFAELNVNYESGLQTFSGTNGVRIRGEWSDGILGSDFGYLKAGITGELTIPTFYTRRLFANQLHIFFTGGTATGELPVQRFGAIDGSMTRFTPFGSLRTRIGIPYEGSTHWLINAEHNFRSIPFELLGLWSLADKGWSMILFGGAGSASAGSSTVPGILESDGVHTEAGVSLNSIFGILRIDFAKRLDAPGAFIGLSLPRFF
ncbi:MAG: DUF5686 family protein [Balneolaceae bacterium]|nr:DUF5686 family protein [Balneolaceae bacterium]